MIIAVLCLVMIDDVMMMIDVFHLTHSITHSLYHDLTHTSSLALLFFALSLSLSLTLLEITTSDSPSDDHYCPMTGKQFRYCCYSDDDDDDDRDADDVMMMIDHTHSITHSLYHDLTHSITHSLSYSLICLSLSPTLLEITTSDSPSDDHRCPMTGKQFRYCCYSDDDDDRNADDVMMMIDVFHLTHSITHSLSHPSYLLQSLSFLIFALTLSCSLSDTHL
jgi:hypothetical protein